MAAGERIYGRRVKGSGLSWGHLAMTHLPPSLSNWMVAEPVLLALSIVAVPIAAILLGILIAVVVNAAR
jgi:hypothetical protein